jgi:hypothetical protein
MARSLSLDEFRRRLTRAFPPQPFHGLVSSHDECDEGIALSQELPGKRWDEIPTDFVDFNSGSLPLLEPTALRAFLPAWLLRSMETLSNKGVVSEFTMYFLCPGSEDVGRDEKAILEMVGGFDNAQRTVVGDFLRAILDFDALPYWHPYAEWGLKWWCA